MDPLIRQLRFEDLDREELYRWLRLARDEDLAGRGLAVPPGTTTDLSSALLGHRILGRLELVAREPLVVCGLPLVPLILETFGCEGTWHPEPGEGRHCDRGEVLGSFEGFGPDLLTAERTILNCLQYLSGIATLTAAYVKELEGTGTRLLDTRKTPPGHRYLAKVAFATGGGHNHRFGLFDRVMLKDNHLAAIGGPIASTIREARSRFPGIPVEVEIDSLDQLPGVLAGGADVVLLDNFSDASLAAAVEQCRGRILTEASGGITLERLAAIGPLGLDFISTGAPVHQARWVDIGLDHATQG